MTKSALVGILMLIVSAARASQTFDVCTSNVRIEQNALSLTVPVEFSTATASVTYLPGRRRVCIYNLDSTAANHVWLSTFPVTTLVGGVLDTGKSIPIPGGNVEDAYACFPWGPKVRFWLHRVIGTSKAAVISCE